jgi:hypothetical protein
VTAIHLHFLASCAGGRGGRKSSGVPAAFFVGANGVNAKRAPGGASNPALIARGKEKSCHLRNRHPGRDAARSDASQIRDRFPFALDGPGYSRSANSGTTEATDRHHSPRSQNKKARHDGRAFPQS